jgi:hypothetical protein
MKQLLLIFVKSSQPLPHLHKLFLATEQCKTDKFLFYDGFIPVKEIWDNECYKKYIQLGLDKTEKIMNAFIKGFLKNYENIILVDNTSGELNPEHIEIAFNELKFQEVVVGPVRNNLLYLIGMKRFRPEFFENDINYKNVMSEIEKRKLSHAELPLLEPWLSSRISV